jgi:hypothetical protein
MGIQQVFDAFVRFEVGASIENSLIFFRGFHIGEPSFPRASLGNPMVKPSFYAVLRSFAKV